jgi:hypothetical protein
MTHDDALMRATVQALEAAEDMRRALLAAAKLLKDCTCQVNRAHESLAACRLADSSISRWQGATRVMQNIARQRQRSASPTPNQGAEPGTGSQEKS